MKKKTVIVLVPILFVLCISLGCGGKKGVTRMKGTVPFVSSQPYTLGPMDKVTVKVWRQSDLSDDYSVDFRGIIRFPLVGEVSCLGFTTYELADLLEEELIRYIKNPQVRVEVKEYNSHRVIIMGAVAKQGVYYVKSRLTIMEAIAVAGGFKKGAKTTQVFIGRGEIGNLELLQVNVKDVMTKGRKDKDILLQNGDIVFIPTTFVANVNQAIKDVSGTLDVYNTVDE